AKKGYLKEGRTRLAKILNLNHKDSQITNLCAEALKEVREEEKKKVNEVNKSGLQLKSRWQSASGEWLESYKNVNDTSLDEIKQLKEDLFNDLKRITLPKIEYDIEGRGKNNDNLLEISLPDFHFGKVDDTTIEEQA